VAKHLDSYSQSDIYNLLVGPGRYEPITPNDSTDLTFSIRTLNVAEAGAVRILDLAGNEVTLTVAAGAQFPVQARRIFATGTTATGIVAGL
jgi:hypothetical protein